MVEISTIASSTCFIFVVHLHLRVSVVPCVFIFLMFIYFSPQKCDSAFCACATARPRNWVKGGPPFGSVLTVKNYTADTYSQTYCCWPNFCFGFGFEFVFFSIWYNSRVHPKRPLSTTKSGRARGQQLTLFSPKVNN